MLNRNVKNSIENAKQLKSKWGWFVLLGVILIILGTFALSYSVLATLTVDLP